MVNCSIIELLLCYYAKKNNVTTQPPNCQKNATDYLREIASLSSKILKQAKLVFL